MLKMKKVAIVTNIPAPYRIDLFYYLMTNFKDYEWNIIYANHGVENRQWSINTKKMIHTYFFKTKEIKIQDNMDIRHIHIPIGVGKVLNNISPDIIIAWEYNPIAVICLFWCKIHHKKFIHLTDGTLYSERNIGKIKKYIRKIIVKYADACLASSSKAKEKLLFWGAADNKIFISLLTINVTEFEELKKEPQPRRILYVGSMVKRKGLDLLINALAEMKKDFDLHIVGNGTENEISALKQLAIGKNVIDKITWCGFKEGKALLDEYRKAELFVLPTREDCFGLVLLEAMCAKLPIITSKYADGAYDIIKEGINGYIIDPFNAKEFGKAMDKALGNLELKNGAEMTSFEKFKFRNVVQGYLDAIKFVE